MKRGLLFLLQLATLFGCSILLAALIGCSNPVEVVVETDTVFVYIPDPLEYYWGSGVCVVCSMEPDENNSIFETSIIVSSMEECFEYVVNYWKDVYICGYTTWWN